MKSLVIALFAISTLFATAVYSADGSDHLRRVASNDKLHWVAADGSDRTAIGRRV